MTELAIDTPTVQSPGWAQGPTPKVAVVIASYKRCEFLPGLVAALESQTLDHTDYEIVLIDNGSADGTWARMQDLISRSPARAIALSTPDNHGPGGGRNRAVTAVRAPIIAFTDDDCLPTASWLEETVAAFVEGVDLVQGQVHADPTDRRDAGPWFHTKWITVPTPYFETCNVSYRTEYFHKAGGFDETDTLTHRAAGGRAFGEDALLAWRVHQAGGHATFVRESLVYHRNIPAEFGDYLVGQRRLVDFPALAERSPLVADGFWNRIFVTKLSAQFDLAVVSVAAAAVTRKPLLLAGALPWLRVRWQEGRKLSKDDLRAVPIRMGQLAVGDAVSLWSLIRGSIRHRRLLL